MKEWSLIQSLLWAQVSQLTFIYLLRLAVVTNTSMYLPQVHWGYYETLIWSC